MRQVKCKVCSKSDNKDLMTKVGTRYIHNDVCLDKHNKEAEFKTKENEELALLTDYIQKLHDISILPNQFYPFIQDLRNGTQRRGQVIGNKKYKKGYSYKTIMVTYRVCKNKILYSKRSKKFDGSFNMLKYTLAIVVNQIDRVDKKIKEKKAQDQQEIRRQERLKNTANKSRGTQYKYKKQKSDDISHFVD